MTLTNFSQETDIELSSLLSAETSHVHVQVILLVLTFLFIPQVATKYQRWFSVATPHVFIYLLTNFESGSQHYYYYCYYYYYYYFIHELLKFLYRLFTKHTICQFHSTLLNEGFRKGMRFFCKCNTISHAVEDLGSSFVNSF
jgi:hypothetical protein